MNKKLITAIAALCLLTGVVFASGGKDTDDSTAPLGAGRGPRGMMDGRGQPARPTATEVEVTGVLALVDSIPVLRAADAVWALPAGPFYRIAWENGVKEGDTISVKGFGYAITEDCPLEGVTGMLDPANLTVNGKVIDLADIAPRGQRGSRGGGQGGMRRR